MSKKLSKQDRQGVRTPQQLEQKYDFNNMTGGSSGESEKISQLTQEFSQYKVSMNNKIADIESEIDSFSGTSESFGEYIASNDERVEGIENECDTIAGNYSRLSERFNQYTTSNDARVDELETQAETLSGDYTQLNDSFNQYVANNDGEIEGLKESDAAQQLALNEAFLNANQYTDQKIADLIGGAPSTLDTLKEIADAMSENESVVEALEKSIGEKASKLEFHSHETNTSNPHGVNKAQVGLGNVPNVSTNNQTPTYSDISTLSTLSSGEKLSAAFSKIKLAISSLITHLTSTSNPHEVTKSQVGLGNVDNTADADKSVSHASTSGSAEKCTGNSATATKLANARTLQADLSSTSAVDFDGSANKTIGIKGTLPITNGGTGATTQKAAEYNVLGGVSTEWTTDRTDSSLFVFRKSSPSESEGTLGYVKGSYVWNWIKAKLSGAISTVLTSNLTSNRALISNGSGKVAVSPVTSTELGYLDGVTRNIQTQLNELGAIADGTNLVLSDVYPVGSIYTTASESSPALIFGGTWELMSQGYLVLGLDQETEDDPIEIKFADKINIWKRTA